MTTFRQLGVLFQEGTAAGLSDGQLLDRFAADRDEAAFAAIVARHGPMVLGICRRLLGDHHHAEDAFQAVFLVLARQPRSIRDPDRLATWLHGVALRTSRKARARLLRRRRIDEDGAARGTGPLRVVPAEQGLLDREQAEALHIEIDRLPDVFRSSVVLCYFEGLTLDEAARRLRWPVGTLRSRLARARQKLERALTGRGFASPAIALMPRSSVPATLAGATVRMALPFGVGPGMATLLAGEVLRSMLWRKARLTAAVLVVGVGSLVAAGRPSVLGVSRSGDLATTGPGGEALGLWRGPAELWRGLPTSTPARPQVSRTEGGARMTVAGRVLGPDGKPVAGAMVDVLAATRTHAVADDEEKSPFALLARAQTDADGRFHCDAPRTASSRNDTLLAMAAAPGLGLAVVPLNPDADRPEAEIKLKPEQLVRVRLVDLNGAPARGVRVGVEAFSRPEDPTGEDGGFVGDPPPPGLRSWPGPFRTDDQGRLRIIGIGPGYEITLTVRDDRFARQVVTIPPADVASGREVSRALEPARIIEGRVLADDTGRPIPGAIVSATTDASREPFGIKVRADAEGRFRVIPNAGDAHRLRAFPAGGEPYLARQEEVPWTKGAIRATHDLRLTRGIPVRGKVTEAGTGRPLKGSSIQYIPTRDTDRVVSAWEAAVASRDDGSFQIVVPPGKGHLLVFGPTDDFIAEVFGSDRLDGHGNGGERHRAHAILPYEARADGPPPEVSAALRPGVTIKGRVERPDGRPVALGLILTTLRSDPTNLTWDGASPQAVRDGRFELRGLDPAGTTRVSFVEFPGYDLGVTVELSGRQAGEEPVIRLRPCGQARARLVGPDGRPVAGFPPMVELIATPGPGAFSFKKQDRLELAADAAPIAMVDPKHHADGPVTDADGRFTLVALIPGATYRISDESTINDDGKGQQVRKDLKVEPGQTIDLGDILIEKPR